jgi:peptide/nickel transport system substrate-binding protein
MMNVEEDLTSRRAVRQALVHATNRNAIADVVFQGFSPVAWGPLSAETLYYNSDVVGMYPHDPVTARNLLMAQGYEDTDDNGFLNDGEDDLEVVVVYPPWGLLPQVVQLMRDQWAEAGIRAILEPVPNYPALLARAEAGDYHLISFDTVGYDPAFLNDFYMTDAPNNFMNFSDPALDSRLMEAVETASPGVRRGLYAQIQQFIMDEALILPIREYVNLNGVAGEIRNLQYDVYGWFPVLNNVTVES